MTAAQNRNRKIVNPKNKQNNITQKTASSYLIFGFFAPFSFCIFFLYFIFFLQQKKEVISFGEDSAVNMLCIYVKLYRKLFVVIGFIELCFVNKSFIIMLVGNVLLLLAQCSLKIHGIFSFLGI